MVIFDITAKYNPFEAFLYDCFVSPGVSRTISPFKDSILASAPEGSRILDVGCGGGQLAVDLKKTRDTLRVTGVDLSMSQVRRARLRGRKAGADVRFIQASALELPFPDGFFDLVYSVDCFKHWPDKRKGLSECLRVTRPGGTILITEVDRGCTVKNGLRFVQKWNVPAFIRPLSVVPFFLFAVLRSHTMDEARSLAEPLPFKDTTVGPGPGDVNWTLKAKAPLKPVTAFPRVSTAPGRPEG